MTTTPPSLPPYHSPSEFGPCDHVVSLKDAIAYAEACRADERRKALEEAAKVPRAYAEQLDRSGWGNRFPDELTAIFNASTNMANSIRRLIDKEPT